MNAMKCVAYVRVSLKKQAEFGSILWRSGREDSGDGTASGSELVNIVINGGASAKSLEHPGMKKVLALVDGRKVDAVIVCRLDRLTRSVKDLAALLEVFCKRNVSLVSVAESLDTVTGAGRLMLHLLISVSQWERGAIGERTRSTMQFKKKNHERVGNVQYGFDWQKTGKHLESDSVEQRVIARIRELRAKGKTLRAIANERNKSEIKTRRGTLWHHVYVNGDLETSGWFSSGVMSCHHFSAL